MHDHHILEKHAETNEDHVDQVMTEQIHDTEKTKNKARTREDNHNIGEKVKKKDTEAN